jgi:PAS domain S-box-containing protein
MKPILQKPNHRDNNDSNNQALPMPSTRDAVMKRRYEAISAGVIVLDPAGIMIYANRQAELILGLSWAEMDGSCCVDPHWKSFDANGNALEPTNLPNFLAAASGQPVHNRVIGLQRCSEQSIHWLLVNASPVVDPQTQAVQEVIVTLNDITELRRAEEALRDSERRLVFALQSIHAGEWELNLQDQSVHFSSRCADIFLGESAIFPLRSCYERVLEYVVAADRDHVRQEITAAIRERNAFDVEGRILRADGVERWLRVSGRPCANGNDVTALVGVAIDITERKQAEISKNQAMALSHEILVREIVENLDLIYFFVGSDLKYKAFNRHQADLVKRLYGTEIAREQDFLSFVSNDSDRAIMEKNLRRALSGEVFVYEHVFGLDGGICKCMEAVYCPIRDVNKKIIGVAVYVYDISERRFAQDSLAASESRYRHLVEESNFILLQLNAQGEITFLNQFGCELLGCSRQEVLGQRFDEWFLPDRVFSGVNLKRSFQRLLRRKSATTRRGTVELLTRSNQRVWVDWSYHWEKTNHQPGMNLIAAGIDRTRAIRSQMEEKHGYQRRRRQQVLNEAISGNLSPLEFAKRARAHGLTISYPLLFLLLQSEAHPSQFAGDSDGEEKQRQTDWLIDWLHGSGRGIVWRAPDGIGVLLSLPGTGKKEQDGWGRKRAREVLGQAVRYLPGLPWKCGVTQSSCDKFSLAELYFQAQAAVNYGPSFLGARETYHWQDLGSYQLVVKEIHSPATAQFVDSQLGPLLALAQNEGQQELLETLRELVTLASLEKIARRLHVHRGTVRYRRNVLARLLERDLESGEDLLNLSIAVKIWDALNGCKT